MAKFLTEDVVRDNAKITLGFDKTEKGIQQGTGQLTTFNQLGILGVSDKPDGWYLPDNKNDVAIILETKNSDEDIDTPKWINELKKNCSIVMDAGWEKVIGIIHNGYKTNGYMNNKKMNVPDELQNKNYYINLCKNQPLDKEKIYAITAKINNCLHIEFGIKNLYHRMIFTACALVAKCKGVWLSPGMNYNAFHASIKESLQKFIYSDAKVNMKLRYLIEVYDEISMNLNTDSTDKKSRKHEIKLVSDFIGWINEIAECISSNEWNGEDVMGIFFNEFNRYKKKSEAGQVFTPDHICNFMYRLIGCDKDDYILDATCGSGAFLVNAMSNMIKEAGGPETKKAYEIRSNQLYGIEFDREIFALACANMLIHKDGKSNLEQLDSRTDSAGAWIASQPITKVLMNPPFESKYGCLQIVENVLDNVRKGTLCAFILPDKKLEKSSKKQVKRILSNHCIKQIVKLPEPLFFNVGITASIFVFEAKIPQNNRIIYGCYMEDDGLETVKNKGRHDVKGKWKEIENYWIDSIYKQSDEKFNTTQWINPGEHLSYQMPEKPFEISEEDFKKTAFDYICFKKGIDTKEFGEKLLNVILYGSEVSSDDDSVNIRIGGKND